MRMRAVMQNLMDAKLNWNLRALKLPSPIKLSIMSL